MFVDARLLGSNLQHQTPTLTEKLLWQRTLPVDYIISLTGNEADSEGQKPTAYF